MEVFLFILGYYVHLAASCLLVFKIWKQKSICGLSVDTQVSFLLAVIVRCVWSLETRLVDSAIVGFFVYLELLLSTVAACGLTFLCCQLYHTTSKHSAPFLRVCATAPAALALAFFSHPGEGWLSMQILVAFTMYQEAMALLPQLWLMRRMKEVESLTSHYVGLIVCSRVVRMIFWGRMFMLGEHFLLLLLADVLHTIMAADYMYLWLRKLKDGGRLVYCEAV